MASWSSSIRGVPSAESPSTAPSSTIFAFFPSNDIRRLAAPPPTPPRAMLRNTSSSVVQLMPYDAKPALLIAPSSSLNNAENFPLPSEGSITASSAPTSLVTTAPGRCDFTTDKIASAPPFGLEEARASVRVYPVPYLFFRNSGLPTHASFPALMMAMRSHSKSASSKKCVVSMIELVAARRRITSHVNRREYGSIPDVGSSRNTTSGLVTNAMANESLRFCPPLKLPVGTSNFSNSATSATASTTARFVSSDFIPPNAAYSVRCSRTVIIGHRTSNCGHMPKLARIAGMSVLMLRLLMNASPPVASSMPVSMEIVVVFPAPLCPSNAETCPGTNVTDKSSTATTPLSKVFFKPRILTLAFLKASGGNFSNVSPLSSTSSASETSENGDAAFGNQYFFVNKNHGWRRTPYSFGHVLSKYHVANAKSTQSRNVIPITAHAVNVPSRLTFSPALANVMPALASSSLANMSPHWLMEEPGNRHTASHAEPPLGCVMRTAMAGAMLITYTKHPTTEAVIDFEKAHEIM